MLSLAPIGNIANRTLFTSADRAIEALRLAMSARNYNAVAIEDACRYASEHLTLGDLATQGCLDAEDEADLERIFAEAFDEVSDASGDWDSPFAWTTTEDERDYGLWSLMQDASGVLPEFEQAEEAEIGIRR